MDFCRALSLIRQGVPMKRKNWRTQCLYLVSGSTFVVNRKPLNEIIPEGTTVVYRPHIDARYEDGSLGVYTFSQNDIFADDWEPCDDIHP